MGNRKERADWLGIEEGAASDVLHVVQPLTDPECMRSLTLSSKRQADALESIADMLRGFLVGLAKQA
jgi:hypothetical protein